MRKQRKDRKGRRPVRLEDVARLEFAVSKTRSREAGTKRRDQDTGEAAELETTARRIR